MHEDICDAFAGDSLLAVMAPSGTQLEVPVPEMVRYMCHISKDNCS